MSFDTSIAHRPPPLCPQNAQLRVRDERLDSLKLLAGQLAHDFNNIIAPLLGYASLIKEEVPPNSLAMQYAVAMENSSKKSERLLSNVLLAARPQRRFRPRQTDMRALLEREIDGWLAGLPSTAKISVRKQIEPCELQADPTQWQIVTQQLLNNARYALATGGELAVSLKRIELEEAAAAGLGLSGAQFYTMEFRDNGIGIPAAIRDRVFDPFFGTRPKSQGMGLGLTIVHSVARLHEGQVVLESVENEGTCVTVWLPLHGIELAVPPALNQPEKGGLSGGPLSVSGKVLLVDDDPLVLEVVRACLMRAGHEVVVARDGREGLELFQKHMADLSLVLSDVTMPEMSGIEMVLEIRKIKPSMNLVLMSGDAEATRQEKLAVLNPNQPILLKKPFALKDLLAVIRRGSPALTPGVRFQGIPGAGASV